MDYGLLGCQWSRNLAHLKSPKLGNPTPPSKTTATAAVPRKAFGSSKGRVTSLLPNSNTHADTTRHHPVDFNVRLFINFVRAFARITAFVKAGNSCGEFPSHALSQGSQSIHAIDMNHCKLIVTAALICLLSFTLFAADGSTREPMGGIVD